MQVVLLVPQESRHVGEPQVPRVGDDILPVQSDVEQVVAPESHLGASRLLLRREEPERVEPDATVRPDELRVREILLLRSVKFSKRVPRREYPLRPVRRGQVCLRILLYDVTY